MITKYQEDRKKRQEAGDPAVLGQCTSKQMSVHSVTSDMTPLVTSTPVESQEDTLPPSQEVKDKPSSQEAGKDSKEAKEVKGKAEGKKGPPKERWVFDINLNKNNTIYTSSKKAKKVDKKDEANDSKGDAKETKERIVLTLRPKGDK